MRTRTQSGEAGATTRGVAKPFRGPGVVIGSLLVALVFFVAVGIRLAVKGSAQTKSNREPAAKRDDDAPSPVNARSNPYRSFPLATSAAPAASEAERPGSPEEVPGEQPPGVHGDTVQIVKNEVAGIREQLAKSGPASGGWTSTAFEVFGKWQKASTLASKVTFSDFRCYASGCSITATYSDEGAFSDGAHELQDSESFKSWQGPKFRSGPIPLPSGAIEATWALFKL